MVNGKGVQAQPIVSQKTGTMPKGTPTKRSNSRSSKGSKPGTKRSSVLARLSKWLVRLLPKSKSGTAPKRDNPLAQLGAGAKRTPDQWKNLRSTTRAAVRAQLEANQPIAAIKKLTLALLEDPEFQPYHDLLCKAAEQRHVRRLKPGDQDPWASMPKDLLAEAIKLEAFAVYVNELEDLLDQAGVPKTGAPESAGKPIKKATNKT